MLALIFRGLTALVTLLLRCSLGLRLLARIRRRDGLKWGVPAMLVAVPYFLVASTCTQLIKTGGPEALYLLVLWCIIIGGSFLLMGPISVLLLVIARVSEASERRRRHRRRADRVVEFERVESAGAAAGSKVE